MSRSVITSFVAVLVLAGTLVQTASASVVTLTGNTVDRFGNFVIGYGVTVGGSNVTINALGVYDKDSNGLIQSHDVGIYELNIPGTAWILLDSTTVGPTSTILVDGFRYEMLGSTLTMLAGRQYRINAVFFATGDAFNDTDQAAPAGDAAIAVSPGFSFASPTNVFTSDTSLDQGFVNGGGTVGGRKRRLLGS